MVIIIIFINIADLLNLILLAKKLNVTLAHCVLNFSRDTRPSKGGQDFNDKITISIILNLYFLIYSFVYWSYIMFRAHISTAAERIGFMRAYVEIEESPQVAMPVNNSLNIRWRWLNCSSSFYALRHWWSLLYIGENFICIIS